MGQLIAALAFIGACAAAPPPAASIASQDALVPPTLRISSSFHPRYPVKLRALQLQGEVVVDLAVTARGVAEFDSSVVQSSSNHAFTDSLRALVNGLRFRPARRGRLAVPGRLEVEFHFVIDTSCHAADSRPRVGWQVEPPGVTITVCQRDLGLFNPAKARAAARRRETEPPPAAYDSAARALGLVPLHEAGSAHQATEIRIWESAGLSLSSSLVRVVRGRDGIEGGVADYWRRIGPFRRGSSSQPGEKMQKFEAGRCGPFLAYENTGGCWLRFTRAPDWRGLWDSLDRLGVATLRDQLLVPHTDLMTYDGWGFVVEVRTGKHYRWYSYSNPNGYADADDRRAVAITRATGMVMGLIPRPLPDST